MLYNNHIFNADLHFHSPYSAAVSKNMSIPLLSKEAKIKGLNLLTSADILHPKWQQHIKENLMESNETYFYKEDKDLPPEKKTYFILGTEVESKNRVHHLLYFRNLEQVNNFKKRIIKYSMDMDKYGGGRPRLNLTSEQLLNYCLDSDVIIGPAHAFTPYFGIFAHYNSLRQAYGKNYKKIKFIELGLSADTQSANTIPELKTTKFFSFSDSHSPYSFRIGREYVQMVLEKPNFQSLLDLLSDRKNNKINYNVGFNPEEGKYNKTACKNCGQTYELEEAIRNNFRCPLCKGTIKKGVSDKIKELAMEQGNKNLEQMAKRPEYKYLMPLAQVVQIALKKKNIQHREVIEMYNRFIRENTEIDVMLHMPENKLKNINPLISKYIMAFRKNLVVFKPGGAGYYGVPYICFSEEEKNKMVEKIKKESRLKYIQKTLF